MDQELAIVTYLIDESSWWECSRITGDSEKQRHKRLSREKSRLCLAGGLFQLRKAFGVPIIAESGNGSRSSKPDRLDGQIKAMLRYDAIVDVVNRHSSSDKKISLKTLVTRWPTRSAFVADVLSGGLYHRHWSLAAARRANPRCTGDLLAFTRSVAYENLKEALTSDLYRLYLLMAAYADSDDIVRTAFAETRRMVVRCWTPLWEQAVASSGLRLRQGISIEQLVRRITVIDEGCVFTLLSSPNEDLLGTDPEQCWLTSLSAMVITQCVELPGA